MKNKVHFLIASAALISLAACGPEGVPDAMVVPAHMQCVNTIHALDIRSNDKGRTVLNDIFLADVPRTDTTIGYGPALSPKAEITIVDGVYFLTRPEGKGTQTSNEPEPDGQGASFLVHASPKAWKDAGQLPQSSDLITLSYNIGIQAAKLGCADEAVFPFKIKGRANALTWSITGEPKGMKGNVNATDITIVGVYDNSRAPRNAIMDGLNIHPHVVIHSETLSGHLNAADLMAGATLFVPAKE